MSNSIGKNLTLTIFGESHGEMIGGVLDGLTSGVKIDESFIADRLSKRRPSLLGETPRVEKDEFRIVSGVFNGYSTGEPICLLIPNSNTKSKDYEAIKDTPRPSHADYVARIRSGGYEDYRGGGHYSGRISAVIVALGAIAELALMNKGIYVGAHIERIGNSMEGRFDPLDCLKQISKVNELAMPTLEDPARMLEEMEKAATKGDSVGGIVELAIYGLPVGLGEGWFSSLDGELANACFSIGGVKGVEFGKGFDFASSYGSSSNDAYFVSEGQIKTRSNNSGGINGGYSNSMPVIFRCAIKPTPSISIPQDSVDMNTLEEKKLVISGRHDPCIVRRIAIVLKEISCLVVADKLLALKGKDALR